MPTKVTPDMGNSVEFAFFAIEAELIIMTILGVLLSVGWIAVSLL